MCLRRTYAQSVVQGGREMGMQKEPPSIEGTGYSVWQNGYVERFVWLKEGRPAEVHCEVVPALIFRFQGQRMLL